MIDKKNVFDFRNYKAYLLWVTTHLERKTGARRRLAQAIHCQATYVTQVLNGDAHFTLEQAQAINDYLTHDEPEGHFFLLLVQQARAGTKRLREYFTFQIQQELLKRESLSPHIPKIENELTSEQQSIYYSSWIYAAVHMGLKLNEIPNLEFLSQKLGLEIDRVRKVVLELQAMGLIKSNGSFLATTEKTLFIGKESIHISHHHSQWRLQAINSLDRNSTRDLHYTAVYSMAVADREVIKKQIIDLIQKNLKVVEPSKEESLFAFTVDFFELLK